MATLVDIRNLTIAYGSAPPVLADFSVTLAERSLTCIVGRSGVGKTSLLRVIAGLAPPRSGAVVMAGADGPVAAADAVHGCRPLALVFQQPRLLPWRRVIDNVMFGLEGVLGHDDRLRRAQSALTQVGLADHAGRWPHQLSRGQCQRVNLARALAVRPRVMLLDEPFSALDTVTRQGLQADVLRLWRETGTAVLLVTQDIEEAVLLAERVLVLGGRPARVIRNFPVTLPYPRQRESHRFATQVKTLRDTLAELVADGEGI